MKKTIFALGIAAIAATTVSTAATALTSLPMAATNAATALTPVTFFGKGYSYSHKHYSIDDFDARYRIDRHSSGKQNRRWHDGDWNKRSWNRGYCYNHPYSWRCQGYSW